MHRRFRSPASAVLVLLACAGAAVVAAGSADKARLPPPISRPVDYQKDIQPIFARSCYQCHGEKKQRSGYRLDLKLEAFKGGDLGLGPPILPGKSSESLLIQYVAGIHPDYVMPPSGEPLTAEQIGLLRAWIDQGAAWPEDTSVARTEKKLWWSLAPLVRPPLPKLDKGSDWVRNPIDTFVLAKLHDKGMKPAPEADRRTLIRRLYFDLIGLPPKPEEVDSFVTDTDPLAYEKLVDQLLASPHYGERWARHWLDVVHYGETHGYDKDKPRPNAWPYRDYVIRAFNEDKPYSRFVQEQIAGDVLFPGTIDGIEALGFIAAGPWDYLGHAELPETKIDGKIARHLDRDDMVANTIGTFNSLTIHCAQCHDHKFDPIKQEDYYSLQAVFAALDRADKVFDADPAVASQRVPLMDRLHKLEQQKQSLIDRFKEEETRDLINLDKKIDAVTRPGVEPDLQELAKLEAQMAALLKRLPDEAIGKQLEEIEKQLGTTRRELARLPQPRVVYAGTVHHGRPPFTGTGPNGGKPRTIRILSRGDVQKPGKEVGPGALKCVSELPAQFELSPNHHEGERRAALAKWLTDPKHPLTWRSIVNRIWLYHFGRGIVDTPNDFGRMGQVPTHPELLDWLAVEFRDNGQSLKRLHRLMVTSATYRQSSASNPEYVKLDANNAYYWRMNRRKLEAEVIRDSVLYVSGKLDPKMGGPSFQDFVIDKPEHSPHYLYHLHDPEDPRSHRRSIYRFIVRSQQQPFMMATDCADPSLSVDKRNQTNSPLQALALLNNQLMVVMSKHFAARIEKEGDTKKQLTAAFRLALGRSPTREELDDLVRYAEKHGLPNACRVLLNLNEFVFVD